MIKDVAFKADGYELFGTLYQAAPQSERAAALLISGGANRPRQETHYPAVQREFLKRGITTLSFEFRGVGESGGSLAQTNLLSRVDDARTALEFLKQNTNSENIYLLGTSMGGPVAIQLADRSVRGLILAVPAAYSLEARSKNFGPDFSIAIRKTDSWKDSPEFKDLAKYEGRTCLVYGTEDEVVPREIFATYELLVCSRNGTVVVLDNAPHYFWETEQGVEAIGSVADFIISD